VIEAYGWLPVGLETLTMTDTRQRTTWGIRFRFLIRGLGVVGVFAAAVGAVLTASVYPSLDQWNPDTAHRAMHHEDGDAAYIGVLLLHLGVGTVVLALAVEFLGGLFRTASRRTAAGTSATIAVAAAIALLIFVNAYSLTHYRRFDATREHQFTLPAGVADELRQLRPDEPTTIVVLQMHRTFGNASEVRDSYASESEAKVAEKVQDLVDQFREFGPRFNVVLLDTEKFGYDAQLADLTRDAPELKAAIASAPENSILFYANKRVQRLGFNEFLQLDRTASKEANGGRGNLVLLPHGAESFARRIIAVQERRPKVAVCVIHGWLGTEGIEDFTHKGLKKTLTDYGFDVTDIVLKKWGGPQPAPAAYTRQESRIEEIEGELEVAGLKVRVTRDEVGEFAKIKDVIGKVSSRPIEIRVRLYQQLSEVAKNRSWLEVYGVYRKWAEKFSEKAEPEFRKELLAKLDVQRGISEQQVIEAEKERREVEDRLNEALKDEHSIQDRRMTDVKGKFAKLLADVDLLILPRYTVMNVTSGREIPPELHALDKEQVAAIRDFMKSGRPVLALLGSVSEPEGPSAEAMDGFEKLLAERGIELGRETVVYDSEMKMLAAQGVAGQFGGGGGAEVEPLAFEDRSGEVKTKPNPIGEALRLTGRSLEQKFDLRLRALRPVYVNPAWQEKLPFAAEFVLTGPDSWNEIQPFARGDRAGRATYVPKYEPAKQDDPKKGTRREERRGPFPVAAAVEGPLPAEWYDEEYGREKVAAGILAPVDRGLSAAAITAVSTKLDRPNGRLVVFGQGGLFVGSDLKPAREKLLLHCVNWLVNRPDRLPTASEKTWSYPRVELSERDLLLWRWGAGALLPLAIVILGLLMMMVRRVR
jgi:hypothetical protein